MLLWLTTALVVAATTPFEDTQRRFHLTLPSGWHFAPQPADTGGATFRRESDGVFVNAMVRVMPLGQDVTLATFAASIGQASVGEPGYRLLSQEACKVDGRDGLRRRYLSLVNGDPHLPKMVEQRLLVADGVGYVLHAETLADAFPVFEADVLELQRSFHLGASTQVQAPKAHLRLRDLLGVWRSEGGEWRLQLTPGGAIGLNDAHGTYHFDQGTLIANLADGTQIFTYELHRGVLVLTGGPFGKGQRFVRVQEVGAAPPLLSLIHI